MLLLAACALVAALQPGRGPPLLRAAPRFAVRSFVLATDVGSLADSVQAVVPEVERAIDTAKPYVEAGVRTAAPIVAGTVEVVRENAIPVGGQIIQLLWGLFCAALWTVGAIVRLFMSKEQKETADAAGSFLGKVAVTTGSTAVAAWDASEPARGQLGEAVSEGAKVVNQQAVVFTEQAAPVVSDFMDDGMLSGDRAGVVMAIAPFGGAVTVFIFLVGLLRALDIPAREVAKIVLALSSIGLVVWYGLEHADLNAISAALSGAT